MNFSFLDSESEIAEKVLGLKVILELPKTPLSKCFLNLSHMDLSEMNLSSLDLSDADLYDAKLSGSNLEGVNLSHTVLSQADLCGANLKKANLSKATLKNSILTGAILVEANLFDANFCAANLAYANLSYADATDATFNGELSYDAATLCYANILGTNFNNANIRDVYLMEVDLEKALWIGVKCSYPVIIQLAQEQENKAKLEQLEQDQKRIKSFFEMSHSPNFKMELPVELVRLIKGNLAQLATPTNVPPKK